MSILVFSLQAINFLWKNFLFSKKSELLRINLHLELLGQGSLKIKIINDPEEDRYFLCNYLFFWQNSLLISSWSIIFDKRIYELNLQVFICAQNFVCDDMFNERENNSSPCPQVIVTFIGCGQFFWLVNKM